MHSSSTAEKLQFRLSDLKLAIIFDLFQPQREGLIFWGDLLFWFIFKAVEE